MFAHLRQTSARAVPAEPRAGEGGRAVGTRAWQALVPILRGLFSST